MQALTRLQKEIYPDTTARKNLRSCKVWTKKKKKRGVHECKDIVTEAETLSGEPRKPCQYKAGNRQKERSPGDKENQNPLSGLTRVIKKVKKPYT